MAKMGFYFNMDRCIGCRTCQVACKDKNDIEIGMFFRHLRDFEVGTFPGVKVYHYTATCNHCDVPACEASCPTSAIYIDEMDGTVQIDEALCTGCKLCAEACPYGVPQYSAALNVVRKCDSCRALRAAGEDPACVAACPMRALEFGDFEALKAAHGDAVRDIAILPDSGQTGPRTLITIKDAATSSAYVEAYM